MAQCVPFFGFLLDEFVDFEALAGELIDLQLVYGPPFLELVLLEHLLCLLQVRGGLHVLGERGYGLRKKLRDAHTVAEERLYLLERGNGERR